MNRESVVSSRWIGARLFALFWLAAATFGFANILTVQSALAATSRTDALVLVNSASARYLDFQQLIQPYLENFGVPYSVMDIATNSPGVNIADYSLIIVGHRQLDTNLVRLDLVSQAAISAAVSNGVGLVDFDGDLFAAGGAPRYQFAQDIFRFSSTGSVQSATVVLPPTQPAFQMHFITARHQTNQTISLRTNMTMPTLALPPDATALAFCGGKALLAVRNYGQGRAVHCDSYDWMKVAVLGPMAGLDDLVWRSLVWAARKPFVMRSLPNFVTLRVDDVEGPLWWVRTANELGFNPFLAVFISAMPQTNIAELRNLTTNGHANASVHSFTASTFVYFNHQLGTNYSDAVMSNNLYAATQWHVANGIPFSKTVVAHYDEIGPNAFSGLLSWGVEYLPIQVAPGTVEYGTNGGPWMVCGPYRRYESPGAAQSTLPLYYADFFAVPGHPELNGKFFNACTEIRDLNSCAEWCPNNDVATSINRGTQTLKRAMESFALATLFTHEWYIHPTSCCGSTAITSNNWRAILQGITNNLAAYKPRFVTLDYGNQYVRATRTSRIGSSEFDNYSGQLSVSLAGRADLQTSFQVYLGEDSSISNLEVSVPAFTNSIAVSAQALRLPPTLFSSPPSLTNYALSQATFSAIAAGTAPLTCRWFRNGSLVADGGKVSGASTSTLTLANVLGSDAAAYTLVVSNSLGVITSSPPAVLTVVDPLITAQPASRTNHAGTAASFNVAAHGTSLAFQWLKNAAVISQATNPVLNFPSVQETDAGLYSVLVSNVYGTLSSQAAELAVASPLLITSISISNSLAAIGWSSIPGSAYSLQENDVFSSSNWSPSAPTIQAIDTTTTTAISLGGSTQRFFRVFLVP